MSPGILLTLLACMASAGAQAAPRAWLQPDRIALGQSTTLNVESDETLGAAPDFSALGAKFELHGQSSSTQTSIVNGVASSRTLYAVVLEPREAGVIGIPPLRVGKAQTEPLSLTVGAGAPGSAQHGDAVFIESELGARAPYVQQAVPYTVRLYYAIALVNGDIDARAPDAASLQRLGEDRNYAKDVDGRRYNVFERSYLLVPEKSGELTLPAPRFRGRARSNGIDAFFDSGSPVGAVGQPTRVDVRPQPAGAPQPWLAARTVQLARTDTPVTGRAGEPLLLELTLDVDGAASAQVPELELPPIDGAQVFPERPKNTDTAVDGRPHASVTRRFAIVPAHAGELTLPALRVGFWNTQSDRADAATLPAANLTIAPAAAPKSAPTAAGAAASPAPPAVADQTAPASVRAWQGLSAALAWALGLALWWGWRRGRAVAPAPAASRPTAQPLPLGAIKRALTEGDLRTIADALRAATTPPSPSLGALHAKLEDPAQRAAVVALDRVMWAATADARDKEAARALLRSAFRNAPRVACAEHAGAAHELPPLYPERI